MYEMTNNNSISTGLILLTPTVYVPLTYRAGDATVRPDRLFNN